MSHIKLVLVNRQFEPDSEGSLGLSLDGDVIATWKATKLPENVGMIENMLRQAYDWGKRDRSTEIRKLLGAK